MKISHFKAIAPKDGHIFLRKIIFEIPISQNELSLKPDVIWDKW